MHLPSRTSLRRDDKEQLVMLLLQLRNKRLQLLRKPLMLLLSLLMLPSCWLVLLLLLRLRELLLLLPRPLGQGPRGSGAKFPPPNPGDPRTLFPLMTGRVRLALIALWGKRFNPPCISNTNLLQLLAPMHARY
jgi:hypothetical protein